MIYLYFPRLTWIAFCTLLFLTGVRGDGSEVNSFIRSSNGLNFSYNSTRQVGLDNVDRNRRALQEIYLIREKKESEDPMNYLSKLYSDMEDAGRSPLRNLMSTGLMVEGIVDPPQIELQFHKKVPNCANDFNITKIIELVDDDKRQRICPCTLQLSNPEEKGGAAAEQGAMENMQAPAQGAAAEGEAPAAEGGQQPSAAAPAQGVTGAEEAASGTTPCGTTQSVELSAEITTQSAAAQASQLAVVSKAEVPSAPKPAEQPPAALRAPKPDQSKAAVGQKKLEDKQKLKAPVLRPPVPPPAQRMGPPLSRVAGPETKKGAPGAAPRPAGAAQGLRPGGAAAQIKNLNKLPQGLATKPLHSKNPEPRMKAPAGAHPPERGKANVKPLAGPGWDVLEPHPGRLYPIRQP